MTSTVLLVACVEQWEETNGSCTCLDIAVGLLWF